MLPQWLDLAAVVVGAFAGVLVARERELDLVGYIGMCIICALGGGLLRDCIMQSGGVYAISDPWPIPLVVLTALIGFLAPEVLAYHPYLYEWIDMFSVALFVVAGTSKAIGAGLGSWATVLMGTITGVGGGMLRDVFLGEIPQVFRRSNYYALCATAGSLVYYVLAVVSQLDPRVAIVACISTVIIIRRASLRFDIVSPTGEDARQTIEDIGKRLRHRRRDRR